MRINSTIQPTNASSLYFGKILSRGDFVKSTTGSKVVALIDNWIAKGMDLLIANPGWKNEYDSTGPIDFLFMAPRKRHAICGSVVASADASTRRFPFIAATLFEIEEALAFLSFSPLILERHVNHQRALAQHAAEAHNATDMLAALDALQLEPECVALDKTVDHHRHFLRNTTIAGLANALTLNPEHATVRQMVLALGYLLQPVLTNYGLPPQKGLSIPLPRDPSCLASIKSLWLELIATFLERAEFELAAFSCIHQGTPKLIVTFTGAAPGIFHALFDKQAASGYLIEIDQATWADEYAEQEAAVYKLSSYLEHGELSLQQMIETFRQSFSG